MDSGVARRAGTPGLRRRYSVRKLIEAEKVSDEVEAEPIPAFRF